MSLVVGAMSLLVAGCAGSSVGLPNLMNTATPKSAPITTGSIPKSAAQSNPKPIVALLSEVEKLRRNGLRRQAMQRLDKAAHRHPKNLDILKHRALLSLELGHIKKADKLLRRAIAQDAKDWRLQSALGAAYAAQGKQRLAQLTLTKALKLSPRNPAILNNLALSYGLSGRKKTAEAMLRRIIRTARDKRHVDRARQNLALMLGLDGRISEAKRVIGKTLPAATTDANIKVLRSVRTSKKK